MKAELAHNPKRLGKKLTWQSPFPATTKCVHCKGEARMAFIAHETDETPIKSTFVTNLHDNEGKGGYWLHDAVSVAVYFCRECLEPTALYNQA